MTASERDLESLSELLHATVHAGASVSFILPFEIADARNYWIKNVFPAVAAGTRRLLMSRDNSRVVGAVQLDLATPPNQRHRAEVMKLLVHPSMRRRGIARELMKEIENVARAEDRSLLTLDTRTGDHAEPLYLSLGYIAAGVVPDYARGPLSPALEPTTFMYKRLL